VVRRVHGRFTTPEKSYRAVGCAATAWYLSPISPLHELVSRVHLGPGSVGPKEPQYPSGEFVATVQIVSRPPDLLRPNVPF